MRPRPRRHGGQDERGRQGQRGQGGTGQGGDVGHGVGWGVKDGGSAAPFDVATVAGKQTGAARARNLEVVPYAGDTTPGVNLDVRFATASDALTKSDQALLDTLAKALKTPDLAKDRFAVAGHTDATGDDRINQELSCARALAVRRYLSGKGVALARLSAYGFGSTRPLEAGQADSSANRRVEIRKAPE